MKRIVLSVSSLLALTACDQVALLENVTDRPWLRQPVSVEAPAPPAQITSPAQGSLETQSAPISQPAGFVGSTVASLGDASQQGFWLETPLVQTARPGKVRYAKTGREVQVNLIPRDGASTGGSSLSLGAMRLLDAPLTGLVEIEVYTR